MKKQPTLFLLAVFGVSLACQFLSPSAREGTVISACADIVTAVRAIQPGEVPQGLLETGVKQGDEFDANAYFDALPNLSMREGYTLDYIYPVDSLGSFPSLLARPVEVPPYTSSADVPQNQNLENYWEFVEVEDVEQGYFEYAALLIMAEQFYLVWHANYNDTEIVCSRADVDAIVAERNTGDFGMKFDLSQQAKIRAMKDIEPLVRLTENSAIVEIVTFTKWGGFYRLTYTIDRNSPHTIMDVQDENIVPYDCGIMF